MIKKIRKIYFKQSQPRYENELRLNGSIAKKIRTGEIKEKDPISTLE